MWSEYQILYKSYNKLLRFFSTFLSYVQDSPTFDNIENEDKYISIYMD